MHWAKRKAPLTERLDCGLSTHFLLFSAFFQFGIATMMASNLLNKGFQEKLCLIPQNLVITELRRLDRQSRYAPNQFQSM